MARGIWVYSPASRKGGKPHEREKRRVSTFFQPIVDEFKAKIKPPENKDWNYVADIGYTKFSTFVLILHNLDQPKPNRLNTCT